MFRYSNNTLRLLLRALGLVFLSFSFSLQLNAQLPSAFYDQLILDNQSRAMGLTFDDNGRMYIWYRTGIVKIYENGQLQAAPLVDIFPEMAYYGDHGLMGFTLDPDFLSNGYMYLYYIVDQHHLLNYGTAAYSPVITAVDHATIGRVTRYQADAATNFTTLVPNSRQVLIGKGISDGPPIMHISHSGGMLAFGDDGSLLISTGDGSDFDQTDFGSVGGGANFATEAMQLGILRPQEDVGTFRAQMVNSYSGKVLRINPMTGEGYPSNPFYDPAKPDACASQVWALGFRQPFRLSVIPNTGSTDPADGNPGYVMVGDVGGHRWEELNLIRNGGQNFGWPLFEGPWANDEFDRLNIVNQDAPNPLTGSGCASYLKFKDLISAPTHNNPVFPNPCDFSQEIPASIPTFINEIPALGYRNAVQGVLATHVPYTDQDGTPTSIQIDEANSPCDGTSFTGKASLGGIFYSGEGYPPEYKNNYFLSDFMGWLRNIELDAQGNVIKVSPFKNDSMQVLCMAVNPVDEFIYYISLLPNQVRKIQYGGNVPPVAIAAADTIFGVSPLTVVFNSNESYDPAGDSITFHWDFGDGHTSTLKNPSHIFTATSSEPQKFTVTLTVTDSLGESAQDFNIISLNNTPPIVNISSISDGQFYTFPGPYPLNLKAEVTDLEFSEDELLYEWQTFLHHNTHYHSEPVDTEPVTQINLIPFGCFSEPYWYRIVLTVTDPGGLSTQDQVVLHPWCNGDLYNLLDFQAFPDENVVNLNWSSRDEESVTSYEIQRAGPDMKFSILSAMPGNGTGMGPFSYGYTDQSPLEGESWYRLKVMNSQGAFSFSPAIQVVYFAAGELVVFPNPFESELELAVTQLQGELSFDLIDMQGKIIFSQNWTGNSSLVANIDLSRFENGMYFYRISNGSFFYSGKVLKQN